MAVKHEMSAATEAARERLLAAGRDLLVRHFHNASENMHRGLRGVLRAAAVAEEAGFGSHAVLYRAWQDEDGNTEDALERFTADVVASMSTKAYAPETLTEVLRAVHAQGIGFATMVKLMANTDLDLFLTPGTDLDEWMAWVSVAPYAFEEPTRSAWGDKHHRGAVLPLAAFYETALELWGRHMIDEVSTVDLAQILNSMADGFVLHQRLTGTLLEPITWRPDDPSDDDSPWNLWSMAVYSVVIQVTAAD